MTLRISFGALLLLLAGCAGSPVASPPRQAEDVPLPAQSGAGDPTRAAILAAAQGFNHPASLSGQPAEAARDAARLEWMAEALPSSPRWSSMSGQVGPALINARGELRGALGVQPSARPAEVGGAMLAAARALEQGNSDAAARALDPVAAEGGGTVLARLAALPPLPRTQFATSMARRELSIEGLYDID